MARAPERRKVMELALAAYAPALLTPVRQRLGGGPPHWKAAQTANGTVGGPRRPGSMRRRLAAPFTADPGGTILWRF